MYQPELGEIHHPTQDQLLETVRTFPLDLSHGVIGFVPVEIAGPLAISGRNRGIYVDYCLDRGVMPYTRVLLGYDKDTKRIGPRARDEDHPFTFPDLVAEAHGKAIDGLLIGGKQNIVEIVFSHYDDTNLDALEAFRTQSLPKLLKRGYILHHLVMSPSSYDQSERAVEYGYNMTIDRLALFSTQFDIRRPGEEELVSWFEGLKQKQVRREKTQRVDDFLGDTPF